MEKNKLNYLVDVLMVISFLITSVSGLILFFVLPGGQRRAGYQEFLGITRREFVDIHNLSGLLLIILIVVHLILHWKWLVEMTKNFFKKEKKV